MGPSLVEAGVIYPSVKSACPCCRQSEVETLCHMVFRCQAFRHQRKKLKDTIKEVYRLQQSLAQDDRDESITLGDNDLLLSWLFGRRHGRWGLKSYFPPPPTALEAKEGQDRVSRSSAMSGEEGDQEVDQVNNEPQETPHLI